MLFFLVVFGIIGIENFQGKSRMHIVLFAPSALNLNLRFEGALQHRCVVNGPAPAGYIAGGNTGSTLAQNTYTTADTSLYDTEGEAMHMGEPYTNGVHFNTLVLDPLARRIRAMVR